MIFKLVNFLRSVADPSHFDTAPDSRINFVETRIRIRPKIEKNINFFDNFSSDYPKIIMLFYEPIMLKFSYISIIMLFMYLR